jgi:hypothetical protein
VIYKPWLYLNRALGGARLSESHWIRCVSAGSGTRGQLDV